MANTNKERYESPSHGLTQQLKVRLRPEIYAAYSAAVEQTGTTKQDPIAEFCEKFAREAGVKIPRPPPRAPASATSRDSRHGSPRPK